MTTDLASIFGVRHLSPAGAIFIEQLLDREKPDVVLIEGPADATAELVHLASPETRPPVAILAFTRERPVRSFVYPLAVYSPEWVAARWALEHGREARFIDLPAAAFLARMRPAEPEGDGDEDDGDEHEDEGEGGDADGLPHAESDRSRDYLDDPYEAIARLAGDPDHDTFWERSFEHAIDLDAYREAARIFGAGLREVRADDPFRAEETRLREDFMRREIRRATEGGRRAVVVCGAYHAPVLHDAEHAMTDAEAEALPRVETALTLMPYSHVRLSSQSGYGAGNKAPLYFELLYRRKKAKRPEDVAARYLAGVARRLRVDGTVRSAAEVIEGVRLAEGLAALAGGHAPVLADLRDAARTSLGHGRMEPIVAALREIEVGAAVGRLPKGVSRTALQDDFHAEIERLGLDAHLVDEERRIELDLREDRTKKTREAAFRGRARSTFLHRLAVLDVGFAALRTRDQRGTAKEAWTLRWTPECEVRLAERSLFADSIETGAAYALATQLEGAEDTGRATAVLLHATECELADALGRATRKVQELTVDEGGFSAAATGVTNLLSTLRFGSVRDVDAEPLRPIAAQLYLRATLLLHGAAACADDAAPAIRKGIDELQEAAFAGEGAIDPGPWLDAVRHLADSDDRHPFLTGYARALVVERGLVSDEALDDEVARRLSPGARADRSVAWFEGLVGRNRAALFLRKALWASLSAYVEALSDEDFRRALFYLRRAFSTFSQGEVRRVVAVLSEAWKAGEAASLAEGVETRLGEQEILDAVGDLGDLDLL